MAAELERLLSELDEDDEDDDEAALDLSSVLAGGRGGDNVLVDTVLPSLLLLQQHKQFRVLWLSHNALTSRACTALTDATPVFANLRELYLDDNQIGDTGVKCIAKALLLLGQRAQSQLEWLGLSRNRITDQGVLALCQALPFCRVSVLWLEHNLAITDRSALALARVASSRLSGLWLAGNQIGDRGALALARSWVLSGRDMALGGFETNSNSSNNVSPAVRQELLRLGVLLQSSNCRAVLACASAGVVRRVGQRSPHRQLPSELLRLVADAMPPQSG